MTVVRSQWTDVSWPIQIESSSTERCFPLDNQLLSLHSRTEAQSLSITPLETMKTDDLAVMRLALNVLSNNQHFKVSDVRTSMKIM